MFDAPIRRAIGPGLEAAGRRLAHAGVRPGALTASGWVAGVGACAAAATRLWPAAVVLWLVNRAFDGLDGPVARATSATDRGGFFDIVADFSIYGGFVVGIAIAVPAARLACVVLLLAYYLSGTAFLALSSLLERRGHGDTDQRSLRFVGGLAEGAETTVVYVLFCLLPGSATTIAWAFAAAVGVTAVQRIAFGARLLPPDSPRTGTRRPRGLALLTMLGDAADHSPLSRHSPDGDGAGRPQEC
jgi:phosphatidylglycerophosphate synthase